MNDNAIINIISSIYSKIVIFFISVFIIFTLLFFTFVHGFHIQELHIPYTKIKELYIKWDDKFIISIEDAEILVDKTQDTKKPFKFNHLDLKNYLSYLYDYFQSIDIKRLRYKDINATLHYANSKAGVVKVQSKFFLLEGTNFHDKDTLRLHISKLKYSPWKLYAKGDMLFEKSNNKIKTDMDISLFDEAYFKLHADYFSNILSFTTEFQKKIQHPKVLLEAFSLPDDIHYWAVDAYTTTGLSIKNFHGKVDLNNLQKTLTSIYVLGEADNLTYTYNKKIEPVVTKSTILEFKNGILFIRPQQPITYGYNLQKSYLKIDFTKKEELLTLYLKFDKARLDKNILHILKTYQIKVPITQLSGYTKTDLTLNVSLRNIRVNAIGTFKVDEGTFRYLDNDINVHNLCLNLDNTHIWTKHMLASIGNKISSYVDIDLYLSKHSHGQIDFYLQKADFAKQSLRLNSKAHIKYYINKVGQDTIDVPQTIWKLNDIPLKVSEGKYIFNPKSLNLILPIVKIDIASNQAIMLLSGDISFKNKSANLDFDLIKMNIKKLQLAQSDLYLHATYNKNILQISTNKQLRINIDDKELTLDKFEANIKNGIFYAKDLVLTINDMLQSNFNIYYNFRNKKGKLSLEYLKYTLNNDTLFECSESLPIKIVTTNEGLKLSSKNLATVMKISGDSKGSMEFHSLKKLLPYSPLLQKYKIKNGFLKLSNDTKSLHLEGELSSKYALLVSNKETLIDKYKLSGYFADKSQLTINKKITINISDIVNIKAKEVGINLSEIENIINTFNNEKKSSSYQIVAHFEKGYLYLSKGRRILYDTLDLQALGDEITMQLRHKNGNAGFRYKTKRFYLYGSGFGDKFMEDLFFLSKFKGGTLNFNIIGSFNDYRGIVEISDATIMDYIILNNILAFIDTVPSLVTFSLPSYSTDGLKIKKAYASFHYINDMFELDNIRLDSEQLQIVGKGKASYKQNFVELILQLKTNLAEKASKIPVVGYVLFDGESISTTLKVYGKLTDPEVTTMLARDIVVAPLNIIKRTLILPAHLLGLDKDDDNKTN